MKIFIDARDLTDEIRGIGFYVKSYIEELAKLDTTNKYLVLTSQSHIKNSIQTGKNFKFIHTSIIFGLADITIVPYLINNFNPDVVWFTSNNCSPFIRNRIKIISTIYDIIYFEHKYRIFTRQWLGSIYRRIFSSIAIKRADLIQVIADYNIDKIANYFSADKRKFFRSYAGIDLKQDYDDRILNKLHISDQKYIYTISGSAVNKNLLSLIAAFRIFNEENPDYYLVITGVKDFLNYRTKNNILDDKIVFSEYISDGEKNALLKNCDLFVFISIDEGFGIPPAEAAYHKAKLLLSNIPVLKEIYSSYALFTEPTNPALIAADITKAINSTLPGDNSFLRVLKWDASAKILLDKIILLASKA